MQWPTVSTLAPPTEAPLAASAAPRTDGPLFVVLNPGSGAGDSEETQALIRDACAASGRALELFVVGPGRPPPLLAAEAVRRAQQAGGVVVAAGGDGTLNAVAQAVLGSGCAFGVLPQGTFNYFGRAHGIPADTTEALQLLLREPAQPVQVGLVNGRVFLVNASLGLYPRLLEDREGWKQHLGRNRFVAFLAALATLLRGTHSLRLRIEVQGEGRDVRTPTLFVGNNPLQMEQLGLPLASSIKAGQLAALMLQPVSRLSLLGLLLRGAFGQLGQADQLVSLACTELSVRPRRAFGPWRLKVATDGETGWLRLPLRFSVAPQPLWLIRPPADSP